MAVKPIPYAALALFAAELAELCSQYEDLAAEIQELTDRVMATGRAFPSVQSNDSLSPMTPAVIGATPLPGHSS
jgi:hypothetical protein